MTNTNLIAEPGKQEIVMTRVFEAPRELVFQVYTDPNLLPEWWGPRCLTTVVDKMEMKPGGQWRFIQRNENGNEYAFHGVYHKIIQPECIICTFEFEGMPGHALLETIILEELPDSKTKLINQTVFQTVEDRDGMLYSGMEGGSSESMERFAELLAKIETSIKSLENTKN